MIRTGSGPSKAGYHGVWAVATMATSRFDAAQNACTSKVVGVDIGLPGRFPAVDDALRAPPKERLSCSDTIALARLAPDGLQAQTDVELLGRDVADVDAADRPVGAVEQDAACGCRARSPAGRSTAPA